MSNLAPRPAYPTFKFEKPGDKASGIIITEPTDRHARKFGKDELDYWPSGDPIIETKIVLRDESGQEYAVYAKARMAKAITAAIVKAGAGDLEVNGRLTVTFTHLGTGKGAQPPKEYEAEYVPPVPGNEDDAPF